MMTTGMIASEEIVLPTAESSKQNSGCCFSKPGLKILYYALNQAMHALTSFSNQLLCESYIVQFNLMSHMHCSHVQSCIVTERGASAVCLSCAAADHGFSIDFRYMHGNKNIHIPWVMQFNRTHTQ